MNEKVKLAARYVMLAKILIVHRKMMEEKPWKQGKTTIYKIYIKVYIKKKNLENARKTSFYSIIIKYLPMHKIYFKCEQKDINNSKIKCNTQNILLNIFFYNRNP